MNKNLINIFIIVLLLLIIGLLGKFYQQEQQKIEFTKKQELKAQLEKEENIELATPKYYQLDFAGYKNIYSSIETRYLNGKMDYKIIIGARDSKEKLDENFVYAVNLNNKSKLEYNFKDVDDFELFKIKIESGELITIFGQITGIQEYLYNGSKQIDKDDYKRIDTLNIAHDIPIVLKFSK